MSASWNERRVDGILCFIYPLVLTLAAVALISDCDKGPELMYLL